MDILISDLNLSRSNRTSSSNSSLSLDSSGRCLVRTAQKEKSFNASRRVLESENPMVKLRRRIEDDDEFTDKWDNEIIRIRS